MAEIPVDLARRFALPVPVEEAYAFLQDVPRWGLLFPHVERIDPEDEPQVWRWTMEPLGPPGFAVQTVYACRYTFTPESHAVAWAPIDGVGNARFEGSVTLAHADSETCTGDLLLRARLTLPIPGFALPIARPAVVAEFGRSTDRFLSRLREVLA